MKKTEWEGPGTVSSHPLCLHPLCCQQMLLLLSLAARQWQAIFRACVCSKDKITSLGYFPIIWEVSTYPSSISLHLLSASKPHLFTLIDFQSYSNKIQLYFLKQGLMGKQLAVMVEYFIKIRSSGFCVFWALQMKKNMRWTLPSLGLVWAICLLYHWIRNGIFFSALFLWMEIPALVESQSLEKMKI